VNASPTATSGPTIELLLQINAAFNSRDVDRILGFFAEDATFLMDKDTYWKLVEQNRRL